MVTVVLSGAVLGGMVGIVEAPRHDDSLVSRVERADDPADDDDHDPLVTWPLVGMVLGGLAGGATTPLVRGIGRVRRWLASPATDANGGHA